MSSETPRKADRPVLWIVAGPNGSGKSSFYNRTDIEGWGGSIWIINPDLLTQTMELAWFARHVDQCTIFDKSLGEPELAATLSDGRMVQFAAPSDLAAALDAGGVELVDAR